MSNFKIEIMDISGKVVYHSREPRTVKQYDIDIRELRAGIYFLRILDSTNLMRTKKLVKYDQ